VYRECHAYQTLSTDPAPSLPTKRGRQTEARPSRKKINRQKKIDGWMERETILPSQKSRQMADETFTEKWKMSRTETPAAAGDGDQKKGGEVMYQVISMYDQCVSKHNQNAWSNNRVNSKSGNNYLRKAILILIVIYR
jgi:hypothetical protein